MKPCRVLNLVAIVALSQLALADSAVTGESLGKLQSTLDFCAQRNPQTALKYREQAKELLQGAAEKEVAEARRTEEYKEAYKANRAALAEVPKENVAEACNDLLASLK